MSDIEIKKNILNTYVDLAVSGYYSPDYPNPGLTTFLFLSTYSEYFWNECKKMFDEIVKNINTGGFESARIIATLANGTVWYDSMKENTYQKFLDDTIGPNQNVRPAFMSLLVNHLSRSYGVEPNIIRKTQQYIICVRVEPIDGTPRGVVSIQIDLLDDD